MKNAMAIVVLILFCLVPGAKAQNLDALNITVSLDELNAYSIEVSKRTKEVPTDFMAIYDEREWVNTQLEALRALLSSNRSSQDPFKDMANLRSHWNRFSTKLTMIKATDVQGFNLFVSSDFSQLLQAISDFAYEKGITETSSSFGTIFSILKEQPLSLFFDELGYYTTVPKENISEIIEALRSSFVPTVNTFFEESENILKVQADLTKQRMVILEELQSKLLEYRTKLLQQAGKEEAKKSLSKYLYLAILSIGGLSIAAIAVVRWFPERVMLEWVESGQVIQFVTVMILLSAIMALGVVDILSENSLGTLLGGIGGYVLSQGVGRSAARKALKEMREIQR